MIGQLSYVELGVPDVDRARRFYETVFGWTDPDDTDVGLHGGDPAAEMLVFLTVPDLNKSIADVQAAGGRMEGDVVADEGFGRFIVCNDDQGVRFALRELPAQQQGS